MISRQPARAACSPNVETRCDVRGLPTPTVVWLVLHRLMWGVSQREKGKSIPTSHLLAQQLYQQTDPPLFMVYGHFALLPHIWAEWVQKPARLKQQLGSKPTGCKTGSSCLQWQASGRLIEKVCLWKAKKTFWATKICCVTPDPGQATWGPHLPLQLTFSSVSQWLQVLSLVDYCSFHFLLVSFGFGYILISCSSFTPK